jgi:hypothetical protein
MGSRRPFGDFWATPKVTQPVKSVDHNTGHLFIDIMNKITHRLNPQSLKAAILYSILINNNQKK